MKSRFIIITFLAILFLVLGSIVTTQARGEAPSISYQVANGTTSGEGYQLITYNWLIRGTLSGDRFLINIASSPLLNGSGCCCTYLPCILRNK